MRYVQCIGTKQSSAGSVTYVCFPPGTGLLRTCNVLRIAGLPVLRNDGAPQGAPRAGRCPAPAPGRRTPGRALPCPRARRGTEEGGFETRPYVALPAIINDQLKKAGAFFNPRL
ncbi:MAG: hypothetical protein LBM98_00035 [Oscillospiraceae bacterium]|nr:hypothetical protein [Oscillospiraceae bacterium]